MGLQPGRAQAEAAKAARVALQWKEVPAAAQYELQIAKDANFQKVEVQRRDKAHAFQWDVVPAQVYFWRVRTIDAKGREGPWSEAKTIQPPPAGDDDELAPLGARKPPVKAAPPPKPRPTPAVVARPVDSPSFEAEPRPSPPPAVEAAPEEASPPATFSGALLEVGPRGGVLVATSQFGAGPLAGLEVSLRLRAITDRLRLSFSADWAELTSKGPRLIATRGYDPAVIQNVRVFPLNLGLTLDVLRFGRSTVRLGVSGGLWVTRNQVIVFSATHNQVALGGAAGVGASYRLRLGPGDVALSAEFLTGALPLAPPGKTGLVGFNAFSGSLSYTFNLFTEESKQ